MCLDLPILLLHFLCYGTYSDFGHRKSNPYVCIALHDFTAMFNNHRLSTENGWSPNQIWLNGMLNEKNTLRFSDPLDDFVLDQHYAKVPNGPRPMSDVEGFVVEPIEIINEREESDYILH